MKTMNVGRERGWWPGLQRVFADPDWVTWAGVTATLAIAPLLWLHYYLLSLVPALGLLAHRSGGFRLRAAAGLSILLSSGVANGLLTHLGWQSSIPIGFALCWVPLWIGVLAEGARLAGEDDIHRPAAVDP